MIVTAFTAVSLGDRLFLIVRPILAGREHRTSCYFTLKRDECQRLAEQSFGGIVTGNRPRWIEQHFLSHRNERPLDLFLYDSLVLA